MISRTEINTSIWVRLRDQEIYLFTLSAATNTPPDMQELDTQQHTASDRTCTISTYSNTRPANRTFESPTWLLHNINDTRSKLHQHANNDQNSTSLLWQLWVHTPQKITLIVVAEVSLPFFLSTYFLMEPPQLDFLYLHLHHIHTFSQQSNIHHADMCFTLTRTHILTHYINFLSKTLMNFWTFGFLQLQHNKALESL